MTTYARGVTAADLLGAAASTPLIPLFLSLILATAVTLLSPVRARALMQDPSPSSPSRYRAPAGVLRVGAIVIVLVTAAEEIVRGYLIDTGDNVSWWRFAVPLACSAAVVALSGAIVALRGSAPSETPVITGVRRTWRTYGSRRMRVVAAVVLLVLVATTIAAGAASTANPRGEFVWLEIAVPNEPTVDPLRFWFFGWAFGVPVLVAATALIVAVWGALHANAARPYTRPETVVGEDAARSSLARMTVVIAVAGMLLALGGAWRLIARAGSGTVLFVEGENGGLPYDVAWRWGELAAVGGWLAPLCEVTAFTLLLVTAAARARVARSSPDNTAHARLPRFEDSV